MKSFYLNKKFIILLFLLSFTFFLSQNFEGISKKKPSKAKKNVPSKIINKDSAYSRLGIKDGIEEITKNLSASKSRYGISVYSLDKQRFYYEKNSQTALVPASNTKLVTTYLAFNYLGENYLCQTNVFIDGVLNSNGELLGDVYIVGGGDPLLCVSDIENLADQMAAAGIKTVKGTIYGDGSLFDGIEARIAYSGDKDIVEPTPPISALSLERNTATVFVKTAGGKLKTQVVPSSEAFGLSVNQGLKQQNNQKGESKKKVNNIKPPKAKKQNQNNSKQKNSKPKKSSKKIKKISDSYPFNDYTGFYGDSKTKSKKKAVGGLSISNSLNSEGRQIFSVNGSLSRNQSATRQFHFMKPALVVAGCLKNRMESGGIKVIGGIAEKKLPAENAMKLVATVSHSLKDVVMYVNKNSDNYLAESVFKLVGAIHGGAQTNLESYRMLQTKVFDSLGINCPECKLNDGSGLSRRNKLTTNSLVGILAAAHKSRFANVFSSALAISSVDGTLRKRMYGSNAAGNVHAKTGTHSNVSSLSGYLRAKNGEMLAFAFIFNGGSLGEYKRIENELCILLSNCKIE